MMTVDELMDVFIDGDYQKIALWDIDLSRELFRGCYYELIQSDLEFLSDLDVESIDEVCNTDTITLNVDSSNLDENELKILVNSFN